MAGNNEAPSGNEHAAPNQPAGQEKKEEKKPIGTLESVVNESYHLFGNTVKLGLAGFIPYTQGVLFPSVARDSAILAGSQIAGDFTTDRRRDKKYTAGSLLESSIIGTALAPALSGMFDAVHQVPLTSPMGYLGQAALWGGVAYPAYFALYQFANYVVRNRTVKGVGKYIKENYWTALKQGWKTLFPFSLVNLLFAPLYLNVPIAATLSYLLTLFGAPKTDEVKEDQKRDKTPYLSAASSAVGKGLKNVFYGVPQTFYAIGSSIRDLYKSSPRPAAPATTAAPQHA